MKRVALFAATTAAVVGLGAWGVTLLVHDPAVARAVWTSAVVALVVQVSAFAIATAMQPTNVMAGWGAGMLLRFASLAMYGLLVVKAMGLVLGPALLSLAGFFFVTTLLEPVFLKK